MRWPHSEVLGLTRRRVLEAGLGAGLLAVAGSGRRLAWASDQKVVAQEPWARLIELADGVWAVVSTPVVSDDWTTGCNGGLVAGRERVIAIEGFVKVEGAQWLADQARELTGQRPTDVLITHFHGDHANGLEGYADAAEPRIWMTRTTRDLIREADTEREEPPSAVRTTLLEGASLIEESGPKELDLGGRAVTLHPRRGHTPSDVSLEIDDPSLVFCGDLVWNQVIPNYRDTEPKAFSRAIHELRREHATTYVSGHGELATGSDVDNFLVLVDSIEDAARRAYGKGIPYAEAAETFQLPDTFARWTLFNPRYYEVAFKAWYAVLD